MQRIRREIDRLLLRGVFSGNPKLVGQCWELYGYRQWLWRFLEVEGIEPTNSARKRPASGGDLAHAVVGHPECRGEPVRGGDLDGDRNLLLAIPQHLRLPHRRPEAHSVGHEGTSLLAVG